MLILISNLQASKMLKGKKAMGKKVVLAPSILKKQEAKKVVSLLSEKRPKISCNGQDMKPQRDLTNFGKWPGYIWLQWQRAILSEHL